VALFVFQGSFPGDMSVLQSGLISFPYYLSEARLEYYIINSFKSKSQASIIREMLM